MNQCGNDQIIKPGDGSTIDDNIFMETEYENIESKVKPDEFYSFLGLPKGDKFKNHRTTFTVSSLHYSLMEKIRTNLIRTKQSDMVRALVSIGIVAMNRQQNLSSEQIKAAIKLHKDCRKRDKASKFKKCFSRVDPEDESTKLFLRGLVKEHGNNDFGFTMWNKSYNSWEIPTPVFTQSNVIIPQFLTDDCRKLTKKPLSSKMYKLSKVRGTSEDNRNVVLSLNISDRFMIISHQYGRINANMQTNSTLLRGNFVCGLFTLCKLVCSGKICKKEYDFYRIIDALDNYAARS